MTKSQRKKLNRAKNIRKKANVQRNLKQKSALANPANMMDHIMNTVGLHENDFIAHDCILCGNKVKSIHDSHNPYPLAGINIKLHSAKSENGREVPVRCCTRCNNEKVMPARVNAIFKNVA